jgi:predicted RNA-binding Zn-ribbon protein involved in translation (DUF1610 family)
VREAGNKRIIGPVIVVCFIVTGATVMTLRATRTDVDTSVSQMRENHACGRCGHVFSLTIADAVAMRRTSGDIVCPKCGHHGATKESGLSASDLVNTMAPPTDANDSPEPLNPPKADKSTPAMTREKAP